MGNKIDPRCHIGEIHGIYTIVDVLDEKDKYGHWVYQCVCNECGFSRFSHYGAISGEKSKTTECHHLRANGEYVVYGYTWKNQRICNIFQQMISRCYNTSNKSYRWYGGKGICVCKEWLDCPKLFEEWAMSNGYMDNLTIDRIDSSKDYCPENCQWITMEDNSRKAGNVLWITVCGETLTGRQWSKKLRLGINTINRFVRRYGLDKTKELILAILKDNLPIKNRRNKQSLFSLYGIQI